MINLGPGKNKDEVGYMLVSGCRAYFDQFEDDAPAVGNEATDEVETVEERVEDAETDEDGRVGRAEAVTVASMQRSAREDDRRGDGAAAVEEVAPTVAEMDLAGGLEEGEEGVEDPQQPGEAGVEVPLQPSDTRDAMERVGRDTACADVGVGGVDLACNLQQRTEKDVGFLKSCASRVKRKAAKEAQRVDVDEPEATEKTQNEVDDDTHKKRAVEFWEGGVAEVRMLANAQAAKIAEADVLQKADAEARRIAARIEATDASKIAEEEAKSAETPEAHKTAEEEEKKNASAEASKNAEVEAKRKEAAEASKLADEEAKRKEAAEASKLADEEAKRKEAAEASKLADEEAKRKEAAEAAKLADEEATRKEAADAQKAAEEEAQKAENDAMILEDQGVQRRADVEPIQSAADDRIGREEHMTVAANRGEDGVGPWVRRFLGNTMERSSRGVEDGAARVVVER
ncbi:unnamed protein product [Closterium sp. NIES-64]|nr:unnamed protein product [Closterium sp. NIES-64]